MQQTNVHEPEAVKRRLLEERRCLRHSPVHRVTERFERLGSPLFAGASVAGCVVAVCADSVYVVFLIGSSARLWRRTRGVPRRISVERAELRCAMEAIGCFRRSPSGGGSVGGIRCVTLSGRSNPTRTGRRDAWRMCATRRRFHGLGHATCPERSRATACRWGPGPAVVRPGRDGVVPVALRSRSR